MLLSHAILESDIITPRHTCSAQRSFLLLVGADSRRHTYRVPLACNPLSPMMWLELLLAEDRRPAVAPPIPRPCIPNTIAVERENGTARDQRGANTIKPASIYLARRSRIKRLQGERGTERKEHKKKALRSKYQHVLESVRLGSQGAHTVARRRTRRGADQRENLMGARRADRQ